MSRCHSPDNTGSTLTAGRHDSANESDGAAASRGAVPWLQPLFAFTATLVATLVTIHRSRFAVPFESDTLWHVAAGEWMLDHGRIMAQDVFSYTVPGKPWLCPEWLSEILMALIYRTSGWEGLFLFAAVAFAGTQALLAARLQRRLTPYFVLTFLMLGFFFGLHHFKVRPHVIAWPILLLWIANVIDAVDHDEAPSFWNLPLMALWANLHGSFVIGLGLLPIFLAEALLPRFKSGQWRNPVTLRWLAFAFCSVAASAVNPNGFDLILQIGAFLLDDSLTRDGEWRPWNFERLDLFGAWLMLTWGVALVQGIRLPLWRAAAFLLVVFVTLRHVRNINLIAFVAPLLLSKPLGSHWATRTLNSIEQLILRVRMERRPLALATAATLVLFAGGLHVRLTPLEPSGHESAQGAIDAVRNAGIEGNVFNDSYASGALIRQGIPVYIDSRFDLYGAKFVEDFRKLAWLEDTDVAMRFVQGCSARWTILPPGRPLAAYLDGASRWHRLYQDEFYVVHVNDNCGPNPHPAN